MKRAVLYARVSTDQQADKGYSLPTQIAAMRDYAAKHGFEVIAQFADDFTGTSAVAERPEGKKLYTLLEKKAVDVVILFTLDRVARDEDTVEYVIFRRDVKHSGAELHFCDTGKSPDDSMSGIVEYLKASAASAELKNIKERTTRGRIAKAKSGKWVGCGLPYGYRKIGKGSDTRMEIDPQTGAIVQQIFKMYLGEGGYKRRTLTGIATVLMREGVQTPRRGRKWIRPTVRFILTNKTYTGIYSYKGHEVEIPELAIVPKEWRNEVLAQLEENKKLATRNRKHDYLLSGRLKCSCGRGMFGKQQCPSGHRYHCREANESNKALRTCEEKSILGHSLDARIWEELIKRLDDPTLAESVRAYRQDAERNIEPKRQRLLCIEEEIERESKRIRKYMQAFADTEDETIAAEYQATVKDAARRKDALTAQKVQLGDEIRQGTMSDEEEGQILETMRVWKRKIAAGAKVSFAKQRELLELLRVKAVLVLEGEKREVSVSYILSAAPFTVSIDAKRS